MNFILGLNEKLGRFISGRVKSALGLIIHAILVAIIVAAITYGLYWIIKFLLTSIAWLVPIILVVLAIIVVIYFLAKIDDLYKQEDR